MMEKFNCEIERVEGGEKITHYMLGNDNGTMFLPYCARFVARVVTVFGLNEGNITEIKANRFKDGTVFVSLLGAQDRIFAKVWRAGNG